MAIEFQSIVEAMRENYAIAPHRETMFYTLEALDRFNDLAESMAETGSSWRQRSDEYHAAIDGAQSKEDLDQFAAGPLFYARYPDDMDLEAPPTWPDAQTPLRLLDWASSQPLPGSGEEEKSWMDQLEDILSEYEKKIGDYIEKNVQKETARRVTPFLLAGLGAAALYAISRTKR